MLTLVSLCLPVSMMAVTLTQAYEKEPRPVSRVVVAVVEVLEVAKRAIGDRVEAAAGLH